MDIWPEALVTFLGIYCGLGTLFALAFVSKGVGRIDPNADGAPLGFRLLIFPGTMALWPLLALRWKNGNPPPQEKNAHRDAAQESK